MISSRDPNANSTAATPRVSRRKWRNNAVGCRRISSPACRGCPLGLVEPSQAALGVALEYRAGAIDGDVVHHHLEAGLTRAGLAHGAAQGHAGMRHVD